MRACSPRSLARLVAGAPCVLALQTGAPATEPRALLRPHSGSSPAPLKLTLGFFVFGLCFYLFCRAGSLQSLVFAKPAASSASELKQQRLLELLNASKAHARAQPRLPASIRARLDPLARTRLDPLRRMSRRAARTSR